METLNFAGPDRLYQIAYDEFGDVLYLFSEESRVAKRSIADDDGFTWRLNEQGTSPVGFTVVDFNYNWRGKLLPLAFRISDGMSWDAALSQRLVSAIHQIADGPLLSGDEIFAGLPADRPVTSRTAR